MKLIELVLNESEGDFGVMAISVVENPATESNFILLSEQRELKLATVDAKKHLLLGAILIPNQKISRVDEKTKENYYIFFSEQTVEKTSHFFLSKSKQTNATLEHDKKLNNASIVESWIVENSKIDKSYAHGLDFPKGTWAGIMKLSEADWQDYVATGKTNGFSIEGLFDEKTALSIEGLFDEKTALSKMDNNILERIKELLLKN